MLALVSASDALMLGRLSQNALSAVSLASQIAFVENLFLAAMTIGLSMLAAQYWGKNDTAAVERIFGYVMRITAAVSFVFFIASLAMPNVLMHIFTNEKALADGGAVYLRTVSLSYFLTGISQVYLCILKNSSKAITAGAISSVSVVLNIFLNAVLIFGLFGFPKLEIAGAALATVVSKLVEVVWCVSVTLKKSSRVRLRVHCILHGDRLLKGDFWKYTLPVLGNEIAWGVGFTMYSVIMGHLGSDAVAANSIANIIKNLIVCFCIGLGSGGGIMVGNELGAGRPNTAKEYGGKLYNSSSKDIEKQHRDGMCRCDRFNKISMRRTKAKQRALEKLIPSAKGKELGVFAPFYCEYGVNIHVGKGCFVNYGCTFLDVAPITLGDGVWIGANVTLAAPNHPFIAEERLPADYPDGKHDLEYASPITLGDGCWICSGAIICGGVTVGENSIIAAGAVVNRDVPPGCIAAGVPAKIIRRIDEGDRINVWDTYLKNDFPIPAGKNKKVRR